MTIARKAKIAIGLLTVIAALTFAISLSQGNAMRLGGPLDMERRQLTDLLADILPPPAYVIEPWLEVNQINARFGDQQKHVARLRQLRSEYDKRKAYWTSQTLPSGMGGELARAQRESDAFWTELEGSYLPAIAQGDTVRAEHSFAALSDAYQRHRTAIDALVAASTAHQGELDTTTEAIEIRAAVILIAMAVLLLGGISGLGQFILRRALNPLSQIASAIGAGLERMASGDLTCRIDQAFPEEHEHLRQSFNKTGESLNTLFVNFAQTASHVGVASEQIRAASADLSNRTEGNANAINSTAATMDEVATMVAQTKDAMLELDSAMQQAAQEAGEGQQIVRAAAEAMQAIEKSSTTIAQITQLIDGIAFQTNLLALNAGVEAARAGEAGKGFAVVANEVRALAQRAAASAKEIGELVSASTQQVHQGVNGVSSTEAKFNAISERIQQIGQTMSALVDSANRQAEITAQVNSAITDMDQNTQQNAAMAEQCNAAAGSLAAQSQSLNSMLGSFKTTAVKAPPPPPLPVTSEKAVSAEIELPPLRPRAAPQPSFIGNVALAMGPDDWSEF